MKLNQLTLASLSLLTGIAFSGYSLSGGTQNKDQTGGNVRDDIVIPDDSIAEIQKEEQAKNALSLTLDNVLNSKEIIFDDFSLSIKLSDGKNLAITCSDLRIDLSKTPSLDLNLSCNLKIEYDNAVIDGISIALEQDNCLYLKYKGQAFSLSAPKTIDQVMKLLNSFGLKTKPTNDSQNKIEIVSIIDKIKSVLSNGSVEEIHLSDTESGHQISLTLPDIGFSDTVSLSSGKIILKTDEDYSLKSIGIDSISLLDQKQNTKTDIRLTSFLKLLEQSTYQRVDSNEYADLTASTGSLFQTLTELGNDKKANIGIELSLTDSKGTSQSINGFFRAFAADTFINFEKGDYVLSLNHQNGTKILNDLNLHYQDETLYLALNDLFKGKIEKAALSDVFTYVSDIGTDTLEKNIADILNKTLTTTDFDSLVQGDLSKYDGMVKNFRYTFNQGFEIEFFSKFFGFSSSADDSFIVSLEIIEGGKDKGLKNIALKGMKVGGYDINATLSFLDSSNITKTEVTSEEKAYKNYEGVTPIFKTLADIVGKKQVQANIGLYYLDSSNSVGYTLNGKIKADMSAVNKDSNDIKTLDGAIAHFGKGTYEVELNVNTGSNTLGHRIDVRYQDKNIYLGYNYDNGSYLLKNQFPDTEITEISDVIKKNTKVTKDGETSANDSIEETNSILKVIKNSDGYQKLSDSLKENSLKELEEFITVDNMTTDILSIKVDPDFFLKGSEYEGKVTDIVFAIDKNSKGIEEISLKLSHSLVDENSDDLAVTLSFETYEEDLLTTQEKQEYTVINNASQLVDVFYKLPTTFEKFSVEADASITSQKSDGTQSTITVGQFHDKFSDASSPAQNSFAAVDLSDINNPICYGGIGINHPFVGNSKKTTADQKVVFDYTGVFDPNTLKLVDGRFFAKYNDNMNIAMEKSDVEDIMNTISSIDESNLLYRYLGHVENGTTGLPIMDMITSKDPSKLLRYRYIKKVEILDNKIIIVASGKLFDDSMDYDNEKDETLTIEHDGTNITKATIDANIGDMTIKASLSLYSFDRFTKPTIDTNDGYTVDMAGFKTLLSCLVNTTKHDYMELSGNLKLSFEILKIKSDIISLNAYARAKIYIKNNEAYAYIAINNENRKMSDEGYRMTEFFIKEKQIFVCQTKTTKSWSTYKTTSEYFYTTAEDFTKPSHLVYYLFNYTLLDAGIGKATLNANLADNIKDGESSSSDLISSNDFSKVIKKAEQDKTNNVFDLSLDLGSILTIPAVSFKGTQDISLGYTPGDEGVLNSLSLSLEISLAGIATGTFKKEENTFNISFPDYGSTSPLSENGMMSRFHKFVTFCGGFENPNLETYLITSVKSDKAGIIPKGDGSKITDNGKKVSGINYSNKKNYGSGPDKDDVRYYHDN